MESDAGAIDDYAAGLFLRYFRSGVHTETRTPSINVNRDLNLLRSHWAVSAQVRMFVDYVLKHPHETQSLLTFRRRTDDVVARGRIDARATSMLRLTSGLPTAIMADEPVRSFDTGPNQVVAWVVYNATLHAARLLDEQPDDSGYRSLVESGMAGLAAINRLDALREPLNATSAARRPRPGSIRDAARSRRAMYRHAVAAYRILSDMESGDENAIREIVQSTLIAPIEVWRRFELTVALAIGLALAETTGASLNLRVLASGSEVPILTCGSYAIYWQQLTRHYRAPAPEPSERRTRDALEAYNMQATSNRPDLVLINEETAYIVAIIEIKYLAGDTAGTRFREAMDQIVRYARGYADGADMGALVRRSLIAMNTGAPRLRDLSATAPSSVDFAAMQTGGLTSWVTSRVLS